MLLINASWGFLLIDNGDGSLSILGFGKVGRPSFLIRGCESERQIGADGRLTGHADGAGGNISVSEERVELLISIAIEPPGGGFDGKGTIEDTLG